MLPWCKAIPCAVSIRGTNHGLVAVGGAAPCILDEKGPEPSGGFTRYSIVFLHVNPYSSHAARKLRARVTLLFPAPYAIRFSGGGADVAVSWLSRVAAPLPAANVYWAAPC